MVALALLVMIPPLPLATTVLPIPVTKPLPFAYTGYQRFPAFYFGSRPEGLQTEAQLEVMAKHSMVGCAYVDTFSLLPNHTAFSDRVDTGTHTCMVLCRGLGARAGSRLCHLQWVEGRWATGPTALLQ